MGNMGQNDDCHGYGSQTTMYYQEEIRDFFGVNAYFSNNAFLVHMQIA